MMEYVDFLRLRLLMVGIVILGACKLGNLVSVAALPTLQNVTHHLVLSQPRSGSTFMSQLLASHNCIINIEESLALGDQEVKSYNPIQRSQQSNFHAELKKYAFQKHPNKREDQNCSSIAVGWKQFLFESPTVRPLNRYIFKMGDDGDSAIPKTGPFLRNTNTAVILYLRRNLFEYYISRGFKIPSRSKMPQHCTSSSGNNAKNKSQCAGARKEMAQMSVQIPMQNVRTFITKHSEIQRRSIEGFRQMAKKYGLKVLYVPYERVVEDKAASSKAILNFLGFEYAKPLESKVEKRLQLDFNTFIKNYGEVRKGLDDICEGCSMFLKRGLDGVPINQRDIQLLT